MQPARGKALFSARNVLLAEALIALLLAGEAHAQRADENAATAAVDAFGTRVGNESVGLYDPYSARGFSPVQAGNVRIEGLYFDQQSQPNNRVVRGSAVRVGISAQSYAFPAPTGIADFQLRIPGDKQIVSAAVNLGPYDSYGAEVDAQVPIVADKLSLGFGVGFVRIDNDAASKNVEYTAGIIARGRVGDSAELTGFANLLDDCRFRQQPTVFSGGLYEPPRYQRRKFFGQSWARSSCRDTNAGLLGKWSFGDDWSLRAGVFRSQSIVHRSFGDFLRAAQPDGSAQHSIYSQPRQSFGSYSGEVRVAKVVSEGPRRHTLDFAVRGRDVARHFGGADVRDLGMGTVGVRTPLPEPQFVFGPLTHDDTRQGTVGA